MSLASLSASIQDIYSLGGFFSAVRFWPWETTVTSHNLSESSLTPLKFGGTLFLDALNCMHRVLTSRWTVALDLTRHLDHGTTLSNRPTKVGYLETPYVTIYENRQLNLKFRDEVINPLLLQRSWMKSSKRRSYFGCHLLLSHWVFGFLKANPLPLG